MKRRCVFLLLAACLLLTACGNGSSRKESSSSGSTSEGISSAPHNSASSDVPASQREVDPAAAAIYSRIRSEAEPMAAVLAAFMGEEHAKRRILYGEMEQDTFLPIHVIDKREYAQLFANPSFSLQSGREGYLVRTPFAIPDIRVQGILPIFCDDEGLSTRIATFYDMPMFDVEMILTAFIKEKGVPDDFALFYFTSLGNCVLAAFEKEGVRYVMPLLWKDCTFYTGNPPVLKVDRIFEAERAFALLGAAYIPTPVGWEDATNGPGYYQLTTKPTLLPTEEEAGSVDKTVTTYALPTLRR